MYSKSQNAQITKRICPLLYSPTFHYFLNDLQNPSLGEMKHEGCHSARNVAFDVLSSLSNLKQVERFKVWRIDNIKHSKKELWNSVFSSCINKSIILGEWRYFGDLQHAFLLLVKKASLSACLLHESLLCFARLRHGLNSICRMKDHPLNLPPSDNIFLRGSKEQS